MSIGERIHFFRNLRGMTLKYLGVMAGFSEKTADIRMAQYETGTRTPKEEILTKLANALDVSTAAIDVPNFDNYVGLMHTFFTLEDDYGLKVGEIDGELCLRLDRSKANAYCNLFELFYEWREQLVKLENGEITREEYDRWRYYYPKLSAVSVDPPLKATDLLQPIAYTRIENEGPNETPAIYEDYEKLLRE